MIFSYAIFKLYRFKDRLSGCPFLVAFRVSENGTSVLVLFNKNAHWFNENEFLYQRIQVKVITNLLTPHTNLKLRVIYCKIRILSVGP